MGRPCLHHNPSSRDCYGRLHCGEKSKGEKGGLIMQGNPLKSFNNRLYKCGLDDIKQIGPLFTWSNEEEGIKLILATLDRHLITAAWTSTFPEACTTTLDRGTSDHSPLLCILNPPFLIGPIPFKFFNSRIEHQDFLPLVSKIWNSEIPGKSMHRIIQKLRLVKTELKS